MFLSLILDPGLTLYSAMLKDEHNKFPRGLLQEFLGGDVPLAKASSSEFCYPIPDKTPKIPPPPTYPRVAVFQRLLR